MDILKKVDQLKEKGIVIEIVAINQIENGLEEQIKNNTIPLITYTVEVMDESLSKILYSESCNLFSEAVMAGIKYAESIK